MVVKISLEELSVIRIVNGVDAAKDEYAIVAEPSLVFKDARGQVSMRGELVDTGAV